MLPVKLPRQAAKSLHTLAALIVNLLLFCQLAHPVLAREVPDNPVEVGHVRWSRDFDAALAESAQTGKPTFLFFQEVPGCIGCQNFGSQVLTHPLLVEAIEDEFIPVLVFNNRSSGPDAALLKRYSEPSWNYQVVRFVDGSGADVISRKDKIWDIGGIASRMISALQAANRSVPRYLEAVALEHDTKRLETVAFAMSCFWTGEYKLGKLPGVVSTEAGWFDGREVTLLQYHTALTDLDRLAEQAARERCAAALYVPPGVPLGKRPFPVKILDPAGYRTASKSDQKKQINRWLENQQDLHLTPMQMTKLNSLLPDSRQAALSWLSPRQLAKIK